MENKELIIKELTRVRKIINDNNKMYDDSGCDFICPHIITRYEMNHNPGTELSRVRKWFESQKPSETLHTQFYAGEEREVWFESNKTRVEFLDYLIEITKNL